MVSTVSATKFYLSCMKYGRPENIDSVYMSYLHLMIISTERNVYSQLNEMMLSKSRWYSHLIELVSNLFIKLIRRQNVSIVKLP